MDKILELARQAAAQNGDTLKDAPEKETVEFIHAFYLLARADLEAEVFRLREHIIDQTKLEQEISQLRKERQAFKDVTEYQASEIVKLKEALDEISDHAPWGGSKDKYIAWLRETARAALGEK